MRAPRSADRHADRVELLRELAADADADREPAARPGVEVGELLGHDDRVVQRQQQDGVPTRTRSVHAVISASRVIASPVAGAGQDVTALPDRLDRQLLDRGQPLAVRLGERGRAEDDRHGLPGNRPSVTVADGHGLPPSARVRPRR